MKIFSYGTLKDKDIQIKEFKKVFVIEEQIEVVEGYRIEDIEIEKEGYKVAVKEEGSSIEGQIVNVPEEEIKEVDKWEGNSYKRIKVKTRSGKDCMMYVKNV